MSALRRGWVPAVVAAAALCAAAAAAGAGSLAAGAVRALAVVALVGAAAVALRRRATPSPRVAVAVVLERHALARDAGVAVVATGGGRLLVGYGPAGVRLLARLSPRAGGEREDAP